MNSSVVVNPMPFSIRPQGKCLQFQRPQLEDSSDFSFRYVDLHFERLEVQVWNRA
jgi:hypothetical protein